jgi:hypothetical protein
MLGYLNFGGDFIAKALLSHDDLTCMNGLGRVCDGIRPVESGPKLKLGLFQLSSRRTMDLIRLTVVATNWPTHPSKD